MLLSYSKSFHAYLSVEKSCQPSPTQFEAMHLMLHRQLFSTGVFLYSLTCLLLSLLFSTSVSGHIFRIGGVRGLTVRHVHILFPPHPQKSISPGTSLSFAALSIALCIPSLQSPTYLTLTLQSALLRSTLSTVSTTRTTARLLAFPTLARVSAGPCVAVWSRWLPPPRLLVRNDPSQGATHALCACRGHALRRHALLSALHVSPASFSD